MTYTLSAGDLWGPGENVVNVLPPCMSDVLVLTTVNGKAALVHATTEYDLAVKIANVFARRIRGPRGVVIKVISLSLKEAEAFGVLPSENQPADREQVAADWELVRSTLCYVVQEALDPALIAEALKVLKDIGELPHP